MEKIKFQLEDGTEAEFYVEEQTRIGGVAYLLVSDSQDDEATAYIFKDVSEEEDWNYRKYHYGCLQFLSENAGRV